MMTRVTEQEVVFEIRGEPKELRELYEELRTWTPSGGWSRQAVLFFQGLEEAASIRPFREDSA